MVIKNCIRFTLVIATILCLCYSVLSQTNQFHADGLSRQNNLPDNNGTVNINQYFVNSEYYNTLIKELNKVQADINERRTYCNVFEAIDSIEMLDSCRKRLAALYIEQDSVEIKIKLIEAAALDLAKYIEDRRGPLDPKILTEANNLLKNGKIKELQLLFNDKELMATGDASQKKSLQANADLQRVVSGFLFKAKAYALDFDNRFRIDSADFYYRQSLHYGDYAETPLFEYANFLKLNGKIDTSLKYFTLYLNKFFYITKDTSKILEAKKIIGDILLEQNKYDSAAIYYISAIKFIELNNLGNGTFKKKLATLNLYLGIAYYYKMQEFDNIIVNQFTNQNFLKTKAAFLKAKESFDQLIENCQCDYFHYGLSQTLYYLGVFYFNESQNELNPNEEYEVLSEKYFKEALVKLKQGIREVYSGSELEAQIKVRLGDVYYAKKEFLNAKSMYLEASKYFDFWQLWGPTVSGYFVSSQLGKVCRDYKEYTESEHYFDKSIKILEKLGMKDSVKYERFRVRTITELLDMYKIWIESIDNPPDKIIPQKKCCILYEQLYRKYPENELFKDEYLKALDGLSRMYLFTGQFFESQSTSENILLVDPTQNWARIILGHSYLLRKEWDKAKFIYEEFIKNEPEISTAKKELRKNFKYLDSAGIISTEIEKAKAWLNN